MITGFWDRTCPIDPLDSIVQYLNADSRFSRRLAQESCLLSIALDEYGPVVWIGEGHHKSWQPRPRFQVDDCPFAITDMAAQL